MPREIWNQWFQLYGCPLPLSDPAIADRVRNTLGQLFPGEEKQRNGTPTVLRWTTDPRLGFPRQPFQVYRRRRIGLGRLIPTIPTIPTRGPQTPHPDFALLWRPLLNTNLAIRNQTPLEWGAREMYEVLVTVQRITGQFLSVEALDRKGELIPGQRIVWEATAESGQATGRLRSPGIAALRLEGQGSITSVFGLDQTALVNAPGWERIEVVGLPFASAEVNLPVYSPELQGVEPPSLSGEQAALRRLAIAYLMQLPPPPPVAGVPPPEWSIPTPNRYLQFLRTPGLDTAPLNLIRQCLENSNDSLPRPQNAAPSTPGLQIEYIHQTMVAGIQQAEMPTAPTGEPARAALPVVPLTILSTSTDSFAATGLGYGTIDLPPEAIFSDGNYKVTEPPNLLQPAYDYMATAQFTLPKRVWISKELEAVVLPDGNQVELAALAQTAIPPESPMELQVISRQKNRPAARDAQATEAIDLKWNLPAFPQGYCIAVNRNNRFETLNNLRPVDGGHQIFVPQYPAKVEGRPPTDYQITFTLNVSPIPDGVSYWVCGIDVFGRWSGWYTRLYAAADLDVTPPGLHSAELAPVLPLPADGNPVIPAQISLGFSIDWSDRTPAQVEFVGRFYPADSPASFFPVPQLNSRKQLVVQPPNSTFTQGFALTAADPAVNSSIVVQFDAIGNASVTAPHQIDLLQTESFIHTATTETISGNFTLLDHPTLNGNPNAIAFVTPNLSPNGNPGTVNPHTIGLWYTGTQWSIYNQDLAAMPIGASFNIEIFPGDFASVFIHRTTTSNLQGSLTWLDHPALNNKPDATVSITSVWNPGGMGGVYNNHPVGVHYDKVQGRWAIANLDRSAIPENAAFNVVVGGGTVHSVAEDWVLTLDSPTLNDNPAALLQITQLQHQESHAALPVAVRYDGLQRRWKVITLDGSTLPTSAAFVVRQISVPQLDPNSDIRRYRLTVNGIQCDFGTVPPPPNSPQLAFAVYALRGDRRPTGLPSATVVRSLLAGPLVAKMVDPRPPSVPELVPRVHWTALPDVTGKARGVINWSADPQAKGYVVWEATETALREFLQIPEPATVSLSDRAHTLLQALDPANPVSYARSLQAFSRLNTDLLTQTHLVVELPGKSDTLYAYRVSAVGQNNLESSRSAATVLLAVPKLNRPGQPRLLLRLVKVDGQSAVVAIALPGVGTLPAGYQLHRVRSESLAQAIGRMGPPKAAITADWQALNRLPDAAPWNEVREFLEESRRRSLINDTDLEQGKAYLDRISPGWTPYFYRAVAIGAEAPTVGHYAGESPPSSTQMIVTPPDQPPRLEALTIQESPEGSHRLFSFQTDLPIGRSSLGTASLEVLRQSSETDRNMRQMLYRFEVDQIRLGEPLTIITNPTSDQLAALPEIRRTVPDTTGMMTITLRVRTADLPRRNAVFVVRDPLGRTRQLSEV